MADITAQLLWYRLKESSDSLLYLWHCIQFVIDAGGSALNWIFVCWILFGFLTFLFVAINQRNDERYAHRSARQPSSPAPVYNLRKTAKTLCRNCYREIVSQYHHGSDGGGETSIETENFQNKAATLDCVNKLLTWINKSQCCWNIPVTDSLLTALTEASKDCGGDVFVTFEAILSEATVPKLEVTSVQITEENTFMLVGVMDWSGTQFSLTTSDNAVSIHSNVLLNIGILETQIQAEIKPSGYDLTILLKVVEIQKCDLHISPYHQGVDYIADERKLIHHLTNVISKAVLPVTITIQPNESNKTDVITPQINKLQSASRETLDRPPKPPRTIDDKKLMIKLIKATKLNKRNMGAIDAYCTVEIDKPAQVHSTSVVKNTVNPYWDEHFLFDLGIHTKIITFRVYRESFDDGDIVCMGEVKVELERLRANHGIRMVLPLESKGDGGEPASGSVTIEGFFVDAAEFEPATVQEEDIFSQSVEPLVIPESFDLQSSKETANISFTSVSPAEPTSKIIRTTTYVQKDTQNDENNQQSVPLVEKAEVVETQRRSPSVSAAEPIKEPRPTVDFSNAALRYNSSSSNDVKKNRFSMTLGRRRSSWLPVKIERPASYSLIFITIYPNQSVTDVVIRELQDRANKPQGPSTTTLVISATSKVPVRQSLVSLASVESLSDQSAAASSDADLEVSQLRPPYNFSQSTPAVKQEEAGLQHAPVERKSRLSNLKKRFTRTKDKKPRSHSIERSSGIDEHQYLSPPSNHIGEGSSASSMTSVGSGSALPQKKRFGGSLRKLFHRKRRSASSPRPPNENDRNILTDLDKSYSSQYDRYDRLSIDRDEQLSRSSLERDVTPPHHRVLSASSSNYSNSSAQHDHTIFLDQNRNNLDQDRRHYSLPLKSREQTSV